MLDKNGKIGGKVSIIDLVVLLLVIVVAAGIAFRYGSSATTAVQSSEKFECVLKVTNVRQFTVDALNKKGVITDKNSEKVLGEIKNIEVEEAQFQSTTADGKIVESVLPDRYTCYVTIEASGKESEDGYIMDDSNELSVGRNMDIYSKYVKTSGEIKSVEKLDQ